MSTQRLIKCLTTLSICVCFEIGKFQEGQKTFYLELKFGSGSKLDKPVQSPQLAIEGRLSSFACKN